MHTSSCIHTAATCPVRIRAALVFFAVIAMALAQSGCSGFWDTTSSDSGTTKHILYVINNNGGDTGGVVPFTIKSSGKLSAVSDEVSAGSGPDSIAITSDNTYLYVGNGSGGINAYAIASDGSISALSGSPYATSTTPASLAIESGGNYVFALDTTSAAVDVYRIGSSSGALTTVQTTYFSSQSTVSGPLYALRAAPKKKYLYAALGADGVWVYKIASGGTLTYVGKTAAPTGGQAMDIAIDPSGAFAYVPDGVSGVWAYSIGSDGLLTPLTTSAYAAGSYTVAATVAPSGNYLYVVNQDSNSLSVFSIASSGTLTALSAQPGTGLAPTSVVVEPGGQYVYVTNSNESPDISIFKIESDGTLSSVGSATSGTMPLAAATTKYGTSHTKFYTVLTTVAPNTLYSRITHTLQEASLVYRASLLLFCLWSSFQKYREGYRIRKASG